jgi:hypothetical protein
MIRMGTRIPVDFTPINDTYPLAPQKLLKITPKSFGVKAIDPYFCTPKSERRWETG